MEHLHGLFKNVNMKKCGLIIILIIINCQVFAKSDDKIILRLKYSVASKIYLTGSHRNDLYVLDVGTQQTFFYSFIEEQRDSAMRELIKQGYSGMPLMLELQERGFVQGSKSGLKRDKANKLLYDYDLIGTKRYVTKDITFDWNWHITNKELEILGYKCYFATSEYAGRKWFAWFCPSIPIDCGPWKLYGLPGAILKAYDGEMHYTFDCVEIIKPNVNFDCGFFDNFKEIKKEDFKKLKRQSLTNPYLFLYNQKGVKISKGYHKDGTPIDFSKYTNLKYNPIEK